MSTEITILSGRLQRCVHRHFVDSDECTLRRSRWSSIRGRHARVQLYAVWRGQSVVCLEGEVRMLRDISPDCPWHAYVDGDPQSPSHPTEVLAKQTVISVLCERIGSVLLQEIRTSKIQHHNSIVRRAREHVDYCERQVAQARIELGAAEEARAAFLGLSEVAAERSGTAEDSDP